MGLPSSLVFCKNVTPPYRSVTRGESASGQGTGGQPPSQLSPPCSGKDSTPCSGRDRPGTGLIQCPQQREAGLGPPLLPGFART